MYRVFLRPLKLEDALLSYRWRNDPEIWKFTGSKPDKYITPEIETEWLREVLSRNDQKRFAICINYDMKYIGNIQLTDIRDKRAQYHIFIGEREFWGNGIGKEATRKILSYGFNKLNLDEIYLFVKKENIPAITLYKKLGFVISREEDDTIEMKKIRDK